MSSQTEERLPPGKYYIINDVTDRDGKDLAVTYCGNNSRLSVCECKDIQQQVWVVSGEVGSRQTITPVFASNLHATEMGNHVGPTNHNNTPYKWLIRGHKGIFMIQHEHQRFVWGLKAAAEGQPVNLHHGDALAADKANWHFWEADVVEEDDDDDDDDDDDGEVKYRRKANYEMGVTYPVEDE